MPLPIDKVINALEARSCNPRKRDDQWQALCPAHEDRRPSLSVREGDDGRVLFNCHAGCSWRNVARALGIHPHELFPQKDRQMAEFVEEYDYHDAGGELLFQTVRLHPKDFRQRRPDPDKPDSWKWDLKGVDRVLYRLPKIIDAVKAGRTVYVCEGEKDSDSLARLGLDSTTCPLGAGNWRESYSASLCGANVVILPDNDDSGRDHTRKVAESLHGVAAAVRVLDLPGLPEKGDVTDWLQGGGTLDELKRMSTEAPEWEPSKTEHRQTGADHRQDEESNHHTDTGNARILKQLLGENLRWDMVSRRWMVWTGCRWAENAAEALAMTANVAEHLWQSCSSEFDSESRKAIARWAAKSESRHRREAMLGLLIAEPGVAVRPEVFDKEPYLLNLVNGTLDLRTGMLRDHNKDDLLTKQAPVEWDTAAKCPTWDLALAEWQPDPLVREYLQRLTGYTLIGEVLEELLVFFYGTGANGKTTMVNVLAWLLGDYASPAPPDLLVARRGQQHPTELAALRGLRWVYGSETNEGLYLDEAKVKWLCGRDRITARVMRGDFFTFRPTFAFFLIGNHHPCIRGTDYGLWRRLHKVDFPVTIPPEKQDHQLEQKLKAELPGILQWAVKGCLEYQRVGLKPPPSVKAATAEYRSEQDVVGEFIETCFRVGTEYTTTNTELWKAYQEWSNATGERTLSSRSLSVRLKERGFEATRTSKARGWKGFAVTDVTDWSQTQDKRLVRVSRIGNTEDGVDASQVSQQ